MKKWDKRLWVFVLTIMLCVSSISYVTAAGKTFTDVSSNYKEAVDYLLERGITKGVSDTAFGTAQNIKRGDAAIFIAKARELNVKSPNDQGFTDLNDRVANYVNTIVEAGIASGKTSTTFDPDANITRQEMARMLANAYSLTATSEASFTDVSDRWIGYVSALKENNITFGKTNQTFAPMENLTRGEFALFIYRAEQLSYNENSNPSLTPENETFAQRVEEIQKKWQELQPTYDGPVLEKMPSTTAPYELGKVHQEELQDALNLTKFVRFLSYLPGNVELNEAFNEEAQAASVVNAANQQMMHNPKRPTNMNEDFYELGYSGASTSNIGIGYPDIKSSILKGYMPDADDSNRARVGHRRWILSPRLQEIGFGYAVASDGRGHTAMKVVADEMWKNEPILYEVIAWPSETAFPTDFLGNRDPWSVSLNPSKYDPDKSESVKVQLTRLEDHKKWVFSQEGDSDGFFNVSTESVGYTPYTIIFQPNEIEGYRSGEQYEVEIMNVYKVNGESSTIRFETTFFDL